MTSDRHAEIKRIFLEACARPREERASYLNGACEDADLRREVDRLLRYHTEEDPVESRTVTATVRRDASSVVRSDANRAGLPDGATRFCPGQMIGGRYRMVDEIGRGGMGDVWRADDTLLCQIVALKFLPPAFSRDPSWLERLRREVRVARTITHPNVCRIHDISESDGECYLVMEFVDGEDLATLLQQVGRFSPARAVTIARQICFGLAAMHAQGVLHRDLKPANILIDKSGAARLTDFGLAATRDAIARREFRAGTPAYMAPEQHSGVDVSVRSDLYSLGLVLYELFTGEPAFDAASVAEYARLHSGSAPTPPSQITTDLEPAIERIILQCLQKDPEDRPATAMAVAAALPGGDMLGELVATGETPAPEIVAAAGGSGASARSVTIGLMLATILFGAASVVQSAYSDARVSRALEKAPLVLADQARQMLDEMGVDRVGMTEAYGFADSLAARLWQNGGADAQHSELASFTFGEPDDTVFWYRTGPPPMYPTDPLALVLRSERPSAVDPPIETRGMTSLVLSPTGSLLGFARVPLAEQPPDAPRLSDEALLERLHANAHKLTPAQALLLPSVPFTSRRSWVAQATGDETGPLRVETANLGTAPVFAAAVVEQPADETLPLYQRSAWRRTMYENIQIVILLPTLFVGLPLVYMHLRRGRGDLQGGFRLAAFVLAIRAAIWLLRSPHTTILSAQLKALLFAVIGMLATATAMFVFYVALEPYVRRYWPQSIISWSRLLMGKWRDPRVGRDLLLGAALGTFWAFMATIDRSAALWFHLTPRHFLHLPDAFELLLGGRLALAVLLQMIQRSLYDALLVLLMMVLLRLLLRRTWLAGVVASILVALQLLPLGGHPAVSWLTLGVGVAAVGVWALTRFGIVPILAGGVVAPLLTRAPIAPTPSVWYADIGLFCVAVVLGIAIFGFVTASRPAQPTYRTRTV